MRHHSASPAKPSTGEPSSRCDSVRRRRSGACAGRAWTALGALLAALLFAAPVWAADDRTAPPTRRTEPQAVVVEAADAGSEPIPEFDAPTFSLDTPVGPFEYRLGRGMRFGDTGLVVGGFTAIEFDQEENDTGELELDSVNLLVLYEPIPEFALFSEIEIGDLYTVNTNTWETDPGARLELERLYAEWRFDDALKARVGKFQTPVGRWNLVPSEPFVWTAIEPVGVELAFDEYLTGAALHGTVYPGSEQLDYWVYGQATRQIDPESDLDPARYSAGGRLAYGSERGGWSVGSSFLAVEVKDRWSYLGGLDAPAAQGAPGAHQRAPVRGRQGGRAQAHQRLPAGGDRAVSEFLLGHPLRALQHPGLQRRRQPGRRGLCLDAPRRPALQGQLPLLGQPHGRDPPRRQRVAVVRVLTWESVCSAGCVGGRGASACCSR